MQVSRRRATRGLAGSALIVASLALGVPDVLGVDSGAPSVPPAVHSMEVARGATPGLPGALAGGAVLAAGTSGVMHVPVWFDDVSISCLVDTGSSLTVVNHTTARRLSTLTETGASVSLRAANGGTLDGRIHAVQRVRAADLTWPQGDLAVFPDEQLIVPCILGMNLLGQQPIVIDWSANLIRPVTP